MYICVIKVLIDKIHKKISFKIMLKFENILISLHLTSILLLNITIYLHLIKEFKAQLKEYYTIIN